MKVFCVDMAVFDHPEGQSYHQLRRLFLRVAQGQHMLAIPDVDRLFSSDFFLQAKAPMDEMEWREIVQRSAYSLDVQNRTEDSTARPQGLHAELVVKRDSETGKCRFSLTAVEVGDWAEQPLRLLLENESDWSLLEAAARACKSSVVEDAYLNRWLTPDGRGGSGEVLKCLKQRQQNERLFVFVDSDRISRKNDPGIEAQRITKECSIEPSVPCHITWKREIENYVPQPVIETRVYSERGRSEGKRRISSRTAKPPRLDAFLEWVRLSDEEKDHDDLKKRFGDRFMKKAIEDLRDPIKCQPEDLLQLAGEELLQILADLEVCL